MTDPRDPAATIVPRRILVVDADHRVRDGLADLLGLAEGVLVVGATGNAEVAVDAAAGLHPDIVVLDPRLPDVEAGLDLIARLHFAWPAAYVLVVGWTHELEYMALAAGADGFVEKCADPVLFTEQVLATTVRRAAGIVPSARP